MVKKQFIKGLKGEKIKIVPVTTEEIVRDCKNFAKAVTQRRKGQKNPTASTSKKDWRYLGTIPAEIYWIHPEIFDNKKTARAFFKKYPQFRIAEKL